MKHTANCKKKKKNQIKWLTVTLRSYIPTKEILVHSLRLHGLQYTLTVIQSLTHPLQTYAKETSAAQLSIHQ